MTPEQLYVYTEEVSLHAELALSNRITFLNIAGDQRARQSREGWMYLQAFLVHFGMVSKLLFAPGSRLARATERATALRAHLEVANDSPLDNRDARNAMEHLDERIDHWLADPAKGLLESVFQDRSAFNYLDPKRWAIRRVYLVEEDVFISGGPDGAVEMPLSPLHESVAAVLGVCNTKLLGSQVYQRVSAPNEN